MARRTSGTKDEELGFIEVRRSTAAAVMVSASIDGGAARVLERLGYQLGKYVDQGKPAWFLPRSLAKRHSDDVIADTVTSLEAAGFAAFAGRDQLPKATAYSCCSGGAVASEKDSYVPDFGSYDFVLLQSSGGKDSLAMIARVFEVAREQNAAAKLIVVHENLGRVEWPDTDKFVQRQADHFGLRCEILPTRPQGDLLEQILQRGMFPGPTTRYCTSDQKTAQSLKFMTQIVQQAGLERPARILNCLGLRGDESDNRAGKDDFGSDKSASNKTRRHVDRWLPIKGWSVEDVWARIDDIERDAPDSLHHYAYDLGNERVSCQLCILGSKGDLMNAADRNPQTALAYVGVERAIGQTFRNGTSVESIARSAGVSAQELDAVPVPTVSASGQRGRAARPSTLSL